MKFQYIWTVNFGVVFVLAHLYKSTKIVKFLACLYKYTGRAIALYPALALAGALTLALAVALAKC